MLNGKKVKAASNARQGNSICRKKLGKIFIITRKKTSVF